MKDVRHLIALNGKDSLLKSSGKLSGISCLESKKKKKKEKKRKFYNFSNNSFSNTFKAIFPMKH